MTFDWLTFDEVYGSEGPPLELLGLAGQKFVGEMPVHFAVRRRADGESYRADGYQPARVARNWERFRIARKTQADQVWRARKVAVRVANGWHRLVTAVYEATGEVKYFATDAVEEPLERVWRVAFRRATVEHAVLRPGQA